MLFNDDDLRLLINNISFKAYLEDSDITHETKDQQLPFVPTSYVNDSMAIRVTEKAKFTFNVFSETRLECVENYRNLQKLLVKIKPSYKYLDDQLVPDFRNVTGFIDIKFKGLPDYGMYGTNGKQKIFDRNNINLHLNSFLYTFNKDLGYIQVSTGELNNPKETKFYEKGEMKLIPIGYKLSMEGKVLLPFEKTANVSGRLSKDGEPLTEKQYQESLKRIKEKNINIKKIKQIKKTELDPIDLQIEEVEQRYRKITDDLIALKDIPEEETKNSLKIQSKEALAELRDLEEKRKEIINKIGLAENEANKQNIGSPITIVEDELQ